MADPRTGTRELARDARIDVAFVLGDANDDEAAAFEVVGQVMEHQAAENDVEPRVGKPQILDVAAGEGRRRELLEGVADGGRGGAAVGRPASSSSRSPMTG